MADIKAIVDSAFPSADSGQKDSQGVLIKLAPKSDTLLISCAGIVPKGEIHYPMENTTDRVDVHKLFICDSSCRWYYGGIAGLTAGFDETVALVAGLVERIAPSVCCAIGTSGGGYMAAALTAILRFDRVLALAPQTSIRPEFRAQIGDVRWSGDIARIYEAAPPPLYDIAELINRGAHRASKPSNFQVIYSAGDRLDTIHAERLRGLPNTYVHPLQESDHNSSLALRKRGILPGLINDFLQYRPLASLIASAIQ